SPFTGNVNAIAWANGTWVAAGRTAISNKIVYSSDGAAWTEVTYSTFDTSDHIIYAITWGNGKWVAAGTRGILGGQIAYSSDGTSWTAMDLEIVPSFSIYGIAYGGPAGSKRFVVAGGVPGLGTPARIWYSNVLE
ncbi:MAG: hypothetical protein LBE14_02665, partial [Treponema sp.]|nr:hypothetical protein [Treponema sp.]